MKLKTLAAVVASALSLVAFDASACAFTAWNPGTTATAGTATDTTGTPTTASLVAGTPVTDVDPAAGVQGIPRYAGRCGQASRAAGNFVTDNTPSTETTFRARFYVKAANDGAVVFRASNAADQTMITVTYAAAGFTFATTGAPAQSAPVTPGRWYAVELNWAAGQAMTGLVQGNGSSTPLNLVSTGAAAAGDRIDNAQLGWISGGAAGSPIAVDAYESRRTTAIGRLCRGDANGDGNRNSGDLITVRNEFLSISSPSPTFATGEADVNEDAAVNSGDLIGIRNIFLATQGSCTLFPNI